MGKEKVTLHYFGAEEWKGDGIERPLTAAYMKLTTK
jgi:hypothetical protein